MSEFKNLPSGWKVVRLGEICDFYKGKGISKDDISENGIFCIRYGELYTTYSEKIDKIYSKTNLNPSELFLSKCDDIIIPCSGETAQDIAKASCVLLDDIALGGDLNVLRTCQNGIFLSYYLNVIAKKDIAKIAQGVSIVHLYASELKNLKIKIPPLDKQEKIAEILSTWDEAINLTINLIESKKQFKKALMQNLLTAKIRFLQFKDEWKIIRLKKISSRVTRRNQNNRCQNVLTISAQSGLINQTDFFNKQVASKDLSNYILLKKGEFAYNKSYSAGYSFGAFKRLKFYEEGVASPLYIYFKFNDDVCSDFFEFYFDAGQANRQIKDIVQEGARNHGLLNLSIDDFFNIKIRMPNLKEQQKIAEVLTACDDEINLLNLKLENLKKQKQGLMQNLLSGKLKTKVKGGENVKMDD